MRMSQFFVKNSFSIGRAGWGDSVRLHGLWLFLSYITNNSFPHIQIFVFNKYKQPRFLEWNIRLRRGVRFGVQLSCTETRFQKCSQSDKNGSKHPMLSITLAYNVISCKKLKETLKKSKLLILQCKFCSRAQKWPKIAKKNVLNRDFLSFFYMYGIWWILMSRRLRICMAKGGRES